MTVTVTDAGGSSSQSQPVTVVSAPVANFTFSCTGLTCNFDASSSTAQATATYRWGWGDGTPAGSGNTAAHSYAAAGTYTVTLTVTDAGATSKTTQSVTVTPPNQPPVASFTKTCGLLTCKFTSTSSDPDGTIASYSWTFGDGGTSPLQSPSHSYAAGGTYPVTLTVTDNLGATSSTSQSVTVTSNSPPIVNAGPDQLNLIGLFYSLTASFSDANNDGPWSYTISWGDGSSSSGSTPSQGTISASHTYLLLGSYTITVRVTDSHGASGSDKKLVTFVL